MEIREITAKRILTPSRIAGIDYSLNPYLGCSFGCRYCYVAWMPHVRARGVRWGEFVEAKANAPALLRKELRRAAPGTVAIGISTDPYQPVEARFRLTERVLEILREGSARERGFRVRILTKSPLVLRDLGFFQGLDAEVGLTVTTDSEAIRRIFEPKAPPIPLRVRAIRALKGAGVRTYAFLGPLLPMDPEQLVRMLSGAVDRVILDRMNYAWRVRDIYYAHGLGYALSDDFFLDLARELVELFSREGIPAEPAGRWASRLRRGFAGL